MKKITLLILVVFCVACGKKTDKKFLVTDMNVGELHKNTSVSKLDSIYTQDSIVNSSELEGMNYGMERIRIFEKGGNQLLELTPATNDENTKIVESIQILDSRFRTDEGISLESKFKDIQSVYSDLDLQQTMKSLILTPKGHSFYFIIDKSEINKPTIGISDKVELEDIPSEASIKHFIVNWN